jgi:hypothetical protein
MRLRVSASALLYIALAAALYVLMLSETVTQTVDGSWVGDFWEHSAVVRELARHLLHPAHPLLAVDRPHEFFSPYALVLAAVSRVTTLSAVTVLGIAGMVNLVLLLAALPRFVRLFSKERYAPFLALFFTLVLWGSHPLVYSGFLHFNVIGLVLPYPSTFGTALTMWTIVVWVGYLGRPQAWRVVFVALAAAVVLLTHPVAAFFLVVLMAAFSFQRLGTASARILALAGVGAVMLVAALLWPYYPFFKLLHEEGVFDESNHALYLSMLQQVLPVLPAVLLLPLRLRVSRRDPLVLTFVVLAVVYALGDVTSRWSIGRVLPYGVLLLHIVLADRIAARFGRGRLAPAAMVAVVVAVLYISAANMELEKPAVRALPRSVFPSLTAAYRPEAIGPTYSRLFAGVPRASVTMASERAGWPVPTYGGRIVAALHPQAFIANLAQRDRDAATFFDPATADAVRSRLLCRYGADYVLVDRIDGGVAPGALADLGRRVGSDGQYVLLAVFRRCA